MSVILPRPTRSNSRSPLPKYLSYSLNPSSLFYHNLLFCQRRRGQARILAHKAFLSSSAILPAKMVTTPNIAKLNPRPEIGDDLSVQVTDPSRTAEIAANAPRYRRKSSTFIDAIHDVTEDQDMAPAQLYSTMSGRLFHSGRIAIVMVGLPARGKTHICVSMARYLAWLGVKTRIFHLGDYRRATVGPGGHVPEDYFFPNATPSSVMLRQKILKKCREDIYAWLNHENGQVAIYDAVNPTAAGRRSLAKEFAKHDVQVTLPYYQCRRLHMVYLLTLAIQTLFLESYVNDDKILRENARNVKIHSPDVSFKASQSYVAHMHEVDDCHSSTAWIRTKLPNSIFDGLR